MVFFSVVWICISLMTNIHLFMCSFTIYVSSLVNCPNLLPIFYWVICFPLILRVLCRFQVQIFSQICDLQILFCLWLVFFIVLMYFEEQKFWISTFNLFFMDALYQIEKVLKFTESFFEIRNGRCILSNAFSVSIVFFSLLLWWITLFFFK